MNRRIWLAGLAALTITPPLVRAFVHDSDAVLTHYDGRQVLIRVGSGDPYRNQDVTVNFATKPQGMSLRLTFRSDGQPDEFVSLHGVLDPNVQAQAYLNNVLVAEWYVGNSQAILSPAVEYIDRGTFYKHDGDFASPFLRLHPAQGQHELELRILPAPDDNGRNFFYDGYGYALRGGPF